MTKNNPVVPFTDEEYCKILGEDLLYIKSALELTVFDIAGIFGISSRQYHRWERHGVAKVDLSFWLTMCALIRAYDDVSERHMVKKVTRDMAEKIFSRCQFGIERIKKDRHESMLFTPQFKKCILSNPSEGKCRPSSKKIDSDIVENTLAIAPDMVVILNKCIGKRLKVIRHILNIRTFEAAEFFGLNETTYKRFEKSPNKFHLSTVYSYEMLENAVSVMADEAGITLQQAIDNATTQLTMKKFLNHNPAYGKITIEQVQHSFKTA